MMPPSTPTSGRMSTCYYHPQSKAKSICPECGEDICDVCRLEGGLQRCGNCATNGPPPGGPRVREPEPQPAGVAAEAAGGYDDHDVGARQAHDMAAMLEVRCANHPATTADMQCLNCLQAYCMDCLPDGTMCAACKADPSGRAAPQEEYTPPPAVELGYDDAGLDFSGGYAATASVPAGGYDQGYGQGDFNQGYDQGYDQGGYDQGYGEGDFNQGYGAAPAPPKPKRPPGAKKPAGAAGAAGAKKGAPAGKKGAKGKKAAGPTIALIAGGVGALALVGGLAWFFLSPGGDTEGGAMGPAKVSITGPKSAGPLKGLQVITLNVASPTEIQKVEVTVDGKYWQKFKAPPFKTDWPSSLVKNGKHTIEATAEYKNGTKVSDKKTVTVKN